MRVFYQTTGEDAQRILSEGFEDPDEMTIVVVEGGCAGIWVSDAPSDTDDGDTILTIDIPEELVAHWGRTFPVKGKCRWALIPAIELNQYGPARIWTKATKGSRRSPIRELNLRSIQMHLSTGGH